MESIFVEVNLLNPLQPGIAFLYPLKTSGGKEKFFRGYRKATPGCNGLIGNCQIHSINTFVPNAPVLYPLNHAYLNFFMNKSSKYC